MARPLSDDARRQMLNATRAIVADVGPNELTIDEVARRSGVAKTTIYRHFPNASALVLAALADVPASVTEPDTGSLRDDLRDIISQFMTLAADGTLRQMMIHSLSSRSSDAEFRQLREELRESRRNPLRTAVRRAQERGELPGDLDDELAATLIEAPFVLRRLIADVDVDATDIDRIIDRLLRGLGGSNPVDAPITHDHHPDRHPPSHCVRQRAPCPHPGRWRRVPSSADRSGRCSRQRLADPRSGHDRAPRILRWRPHAVQVAPGPGRNRFSKDRVVVTEPHPIRFDEFLRGTSGGDRQTERGTGGRISERPKPARCDRAMPSGDRRRRVAHRIRMGPRRQAVATAPRRRRHLTINRQRTPSRRRFESSHHSYSSTRRSPDTGPRRRPRVPHHRAAAEFQSSPAH
jgi:AcrR family transcriptional regulator